MIEAAQFAPKRSGRARRVRLILYEIDRADERTSAIKRCLRALGDLDPFEIEKLDRSAARFGDRDAVPGKPIRAAD